MVGARPVQEMEVADWDRLMAVNLRSVFVEGRSDAFSDEAISNT